MKAALVVGHVRLESYLLNSKLTVQFLLIK